MATKSEPRKPAGWQLLLAAACIYAAGCSASEGADTDGSPSETGTDTEGRASAGQTTTGADGSGQDVTGSGSADTSESTDESESSGGSCEGPDCEPPEPCLEGETFEVVEGVIGGNGFGPQIAVDTSGDVHLAYHVRPTGAGTPTGVAYARRASDSGWVHESLDSGFVGRNSISLGLGTDQRAHVAYLAELEGEEPGVISISELRYATESDGGWTVEAVDTYDLTSSSSTALASDSAGRVMLLYMQNLGERRVTTATLADGLWTLETIEGAGMPDVSNPWFTLAIDDLDIPHFAYRANGGFVLYAYRPVGVAWELRTAVTDSASSVDLGVGPESSIHLALGDSDDLAYAEGDGAGFERITLETPHRGEPAIAVRGDGALCIAYPALDTNTLGLACRSAEGAWSFDIHARDGLVDGKPSIAYGPDGSLHVVFAEQLDVLRSLVHLRRCDGA